MIGIRSQYAIIITSQTSYMELKMKHQLQQAKAHLSQLVKDAISKGPQEITLHGKSVVVIISKKEYDKLTKPKLSFVEFMRKSPWVGTKIKTTRDTSFTREVDL
jgi:antitoxin Phd